MPRIPTDYNKGLIYKIVCNDINIKEVYYGSTTNFKARKANHKCCCSNENHKDYNNPKYSFIRANGGWDNFNMVLVKYCPCNNRLELEREERLCMEQDENRLNIKIPARTDDERKEYLKQLYIDNGDKIREQQKQYRINNTDKKKEYNKRWYLKNKEKKRQYYLKKKEQKNKNI